MTQDQYGQAQDAGYGVRGDVIEDQNDEYPADQSKPKTTFQKVASALRGDRDEPDEDQTAATEVAATPVGTAPVGTAPATAGAGDREGDYWDESGAQVVGAVEVVTVTTPDVPVTDSDADPLAGQDETVSQTRPDVPGARLDAVDDGNVGGGRAYAGDSPQAGAATIPDVPVVTPAPEDSAATEAPNGVGRHAGPPAQELRPDEAPNTLDDLGDLAYGKLLPDAVDFTAQWQQIQFRFVDDPQASVTEAAEVVEQVTAKLEAAIAERKRAIEERQRAITERQRSLRGRWGEGAEADTETLRETLRMYRAFLDQLIGPKA